MWIGQWDHGSTNGRCGDARTAPALHPTCRFDQFQYALHAWFDKHLEQRDVDTGPAVEVFLNGETPVDTSNPNNIMFPETKDGPVYTAPTWTETNVIQTLYPDATDLSLGTERPAARGRQRVVHHDGGGRCGEHRPWPGDLPVRNL